MDCDSSRNIQVPNASHISSDISQAVVICTYSFTHCCSKEPAGNPHNPTGKPSGLLYCVLYPPKMGTFCTEQILLWKSATSLSNVRVLLPPDLPAAKSSLYNHFTDMKAQRSWPCLGASKAANTRVTRGGRRSSSGRETVGRRRCVRWIAPGGP